jgi:Domain of unknown function (DUF3471)/Domain of unknown function (DUF4440)
MELLIWPELTVCIVLLLGQSNEPATQPRYKKPTTVEQELIDDAKARASAYAKGNCQLWATYVSPDFTFIDQSGQTFTLAQEMKECQPRNPSLGAKNERILFDFHVRWLGPKLALVDYRYDETAHMGETELKQSFRHLDTFEPREGRWIVTFAMQVQIFDDPKVAKIDPNGYDAYAGEYALSSTIVDIVRRNGNKLFIQGQDDQTPTEIFPESADTFFVPGDPTRLKFVRDANGKVIALISQFPERQIFRETKIK